MKEMLLVRYGEIGLKGKNIRSFEKKLVSNIRKAVASFPDAVVLDKHGRVVVEYEPHNQDAIIEAVNNVFGVVSVSPAVRMDRDIENLKVECLKLMQRLMEEQDIKTFKVETRRADKSYPLKTPEINQIVGAHLYKNLQPIKVDVNNPDIMLTMEY